MNSRVHAFASGGAEAHQAVFKVTCCLPTLALYEKVNQMRTESRSVGGLPIVQEQFDKIVDERFRRVKMEKRKGEEKRSLENL